MRGAWVGEADCLSFVDLRDHPGDQLMPELAGVPDEDPAYRIRKRDPCSSPEGQSFSEVALEEGACELHCDDADTHHACPIHTECEHEDDGSSGGEHRDLLIHQ